MIDIDPRELVTPAPDPSTALPEYPLTFEPRYHQRIWGGRALETRYGRMLPPGPIGESWELVDRPDAVSVVANGPLRGLDLHTLWTHHPKLFGAARGGSGRFPLLIKLLDCRDRLSVQVHPDAHAAERLGGEPKSELWAFLETSSDAEIFAGLKRGATRQQLEAALDAGGAGVVPLLHRLAPRAGDLMCIPAGRVHAIGGGNLLCEIQHSSDTTWRVYDWGRLGLDGQPRALHRAQALESIHFDDLEPSFEPSDSCGPIDAGTFRVESIPMDAPARFGAVGRFSIGVVVAGTVEIGGERFSAGQCWILPAGLGGAVARPLERGTRLLKVELRPASIP